MAFDEYVFAMSKSRQRAVFGASCYWGSEAAFRAVPGIVDSAVGFMCDSLCCNEKPSSDEEAKVMCMVEVVQVDFDPDQVSYSELLETYWCCHDATRDACCLEDGHPSLERSVLFVTGDEQRHAAEIGRNEVNQSERFTTPVTTTIEPVAYFHRAVESEQRYFERNEGVICSAKLAVSDKDAAE